MNLKSVVPHSRVRIYLFRSLLFSPFLTIFFYALVLITKGTWFNVFYKLWYTNGLNVVITTYCMFATLLLIYHRWRDQKRDYSSLVELESFLSTIGKITRDSAGKILDAIKKNEIFCSGEMICARFSRLMRHVQTGSSWGETDSLMKGMGAYDLDAIESSHTWTKFFIWLIPIIGFIGTVLGIGLAIGGFNAVLTGSKDFTAMKTSLGGITNSLAYAFETTLVALYADSLLMVLLSMVQKQGDDLLERVEEVFTDEILVRIEHIEPAEKGAMPLDQQALDVFSRFSSSADKLTELGKLDSFEGTLIEIKNMLERLTPVLHDLQKKRSLQIKLEEIKEP
ncbi:MAG: MotA/TolQ/ExbB proton channel family protein [Candidatus Aureabacteria bacterium]|nr:MotA/TolQ/ExbB proton channel family protein [Candidatus Auribacterota bacterium]